MPKGTSADAASTHASADGGERRQRPQLEETRKVDVVKQCHALPRDAALERERELQRIATRAGKLNGLTC